MGYICTRCGGTNVACEAIVNPNTGKIIDYFKDGNEKYSTKNLPKAHFRWDWGRYTLSKESVDKITEFVDAILKS